MIKTKLILNFALIVLWFIKNNTDITYAFLAHLSWKLKWTFLIAWSPSSACLSVRQLNFNMFIFFFKTVGPISTKLGNKASLFEDGHGFTNEDHSILKKEVNEYFNFPNHFFSYQMCLVI